MNPIRLDHHDQKEPSTTERVYRHLFAAVRAAHSGHAFAVLEHWDMAMTLTASEQGNSLQLFDMRTAAMEAFGMRDNSESEQPNHRQLPGGTSPC